MAGLSGGGGGPAIEHSPNGPGQRVVLVDSLRVPLLFRRHRPRPGGLLPGASSSSGRYRSRSSPWPPRKSSASGFAAIGWPGSSARLPAGPRSRRTSSPAVFYLYRDRIVLSHAGLWAVSAVLAVLAVQPWARACRSASPCSGATCCSTPATWASPGCTTGRDGRDLSYGMYLYSYPLQRLIVRWLAPTLGTPTIVVTPILIFLASIPLALSVRPGELARRGIPRPAGAAAAGGVARPPLRRGPRDDRRPRNRPHRRPASQKPGASNRLTIEAGPAARR